MQLTAQGSVTIKRLRNGDTLSIALNVSGALIQYVDEQTDTAVPDWTVAANQPTITPAFSTARNQKVSLFKFLWYYNGVEITFGSDGYNTNSQFNKYFYVNSETGALTIKKNLASSTNMASDTLKFWASVVVGGSNTETTKSIDITIQPVGASAYNGMVTADKTYIGEGEKATLSTMLINGTSTVSTYGIKWYSGDNLLSDYTNKTTLTVDRDMVNSSQVFIAEFYTDTTLGVKLCRAGITIVDTADAYSVEMSCSPTDKNVSENTPVTVTSKLMKTDENGAKVEVETTDDQWETAVYETTDFTITKNADGSEHKVNGPQITVTTQDTDYTDSDGVSQVRDVEVISTVTI